MSSLKELLCQLSSFLKPVMDHAVAEPLFRMHHGRNTFTLEVNWAYVKESSEINFEKSAVTRKTKMAAEVPAESRVHQEPRAEQTEAGTTEAAREQRSAGMLRGNPAVARPSTPEQPRAIATSTPIVISPGDTAIVEAGPDTRTQSPMDQGTPGTKPPAEEPPPPDDSEKRSKVDGEWDPRAHGTHTIDSYGFLQEDAFMYRAIKKGVTDHVIAAVPMYYTATEKNETQNRRAYGVVTFVNHQLLEGHTTSGERYTSQLHHESPKRENCYLRGHRDHLPDVGRGECQAVCSGGGHR